MLGLTTCYTRKKFDEFGNLAGCRAYPKPDEDDDCYCEGFSDNGDLSTTCDAWLERNYDLVPVPGDWDRHYDCPQSTMDILGIQTCFTRKKFDEFGNLEGCRAYWSDCIGCAFDLNWEPENDCYCEGFSDNGDLSSTCDAILENYLPPQQQNDNNEKYWDCSQWFYEWFGSNSDLCEKVVTYN